MHFPNRLSTGVLLCLLVQLAVAHPAAAVTRPDIEFAPRTYQCLKAFASPVIDGLDEDPAWQNADWTADFVDITGDDELEPGLRTRVKMLWDDDAFYVLAALEEPDIQGQLTERDSVIYRENDFELFIDPDRDNHMYGELEINALGTVWDLLLNRPYRDGGEAINGWDITGLRSAVSLDGTVNDPSDADTGWSVELAIPWSSLAEISRASMPPRQGDRWHVNFSRVQYYTVDNGGAYERSSGEDGQPLPPENWVWSPQGVVAMHCPEMWGIVEFAGGIVTPQLPELNSEDYARQALMCMYYWQHDFHDEHGRYSSEKVERWYDAYPLPDVDSFRDWLVQDSIYASPGHFRFSMSNGERTLSIDESGRIGSFNEPIEPITYEALPVPDPDENDSAEEEAAVEADTDEESEPQRSGTRPRRPARP